MHGVRCCLAQGRMVYLFVTHSWQIENETKKNNKQTGVQSSKFLIAAQSKNEIPTACTKRARMREQEEESEKERERASDTNAPMVSVSISRSVVCAQRISLAQTYE